MHILFIRVDQRTSLPAAWAKWFSVSYCSVPLSWPRLWSPSTTKVAWARRTISPYLARWACCCQHSTSVSCRKMWRFAWKWWPTHYTGARGIVWVHGNRSCSCCPFSVHRKCSVWMGLESLIVRWRFSQRKIRNSFLSELKLPRDKSFASSKSIDNNPSLSTDHSDDFFIYFDSTQLLGRAPCAPH